METVRLIGMTICITAVCSAIFSMLVPNSKLADVVKFAISIFFILGVISPFVGKSLSFDFSGDIKMQSEKTVTSINNSVNKNLKGAIENRISAECERVLKAKGYAVKKVAVTVNITEKDGISINRITVYTDQNGLKNKGDISSVINEKMGIGAEVTT